MFKSSLTVKKHYKILCRIKIYTLNKFVKKEQKYLKSSTVWT